MNSGNSAETNNAQVPTQSNQQATPNSSTTNNPPNNGTNSTTTTSNNVPNNVTDSANVADNNSQQQQNLDEVSNENEFSSQVEDTDFTNLSDEELMKLVGGRQGLIERLNEDVQKRSEDIKNFNYLVNDPSLQRLLTEQIVPYLDPNSKDLGSKLLGALQHEIREGRVDKVAPFIKTITCANAYHNNTVSTLSRQLEEERLIRRQLEEEKKKGQRQPQRQPQNQQQNTNPRNLRNVNTKDYIDLPDVTSFFRTNPSQNNLQTVSTTASMTGGANQQQQPPTQQYNIPPNPYPNTPNSIYLGQTTKKRPLRELYQLPAGAINTIDFKAQKK